jgi:chemotaxis response regulator CheB
VGIQRVLVVENKSLLGAGLENLLSTDPSLIVHGTSSGGDVELHQAIKDFRPDVIVLVQATAVPGFSQLFDRFADYPRLRVVTVSQDGAQVLIYDRHQVSVQRATDLITAIRGNC